VGSMALPTVDVAGSWKCFDWVPIHLFNEEKTMPQSTHDRIAELHNLASHAHAAAATAHGKGDHLTAHELSTKAHEHSTNAHKLSEESVAPKDS
jgi:hypothetical protein